MNQDSRQRGTERECNQLAGPMSASSSSPAWVRGSVVAWVTPASQDERQAKGVIYGGLGKG